MMLPAPADRLIPVPSFSLGEIKHGSIPVAGVAAGGRRWRVMWVDRDGEPVQVTTPFGADEWSQPTPLRTDDVLEDAPTVMRLPDGVLAWAGNASRRFALRSKRRMDGVPARFPGAGLVISRQTDEGWTDLAFADDPPDGEVLSASLCALSEELLAAYVVPDEQGRSICRVLRFSLEAAAPATGRWRSLPDYPLKPGVACVIAGVHDSVLIAAGGANFPDLPPWENGVKRTYSDMFVLLPGATAWTSAGQLPAPRAYSAVVSVPDGVLVIGGENAGGLFSDCFFMQWNGRETVLKPAPSLPLPLTCATAVVLGSKVYLAGGYEVRPTRVSTNSFFCLDLNDLAAGWQTRASWPGPSRALTVIAALDQEIYIISGLEMKPGEDGQPRMNYLTDAYRFRRTGEWERLPDLPWSTVAAPSPAPVTTEPQRVLVCGGVDGRQVGKVPRDHRVSDEIVYFDVKRNQWGLWPERWDESVVCSSPIPFGGEWVLVSGEIMAGKRTVAVRAWDVGP